MVKIGPFELQGEPLGQGAFGVVYRAVDRRIDRVVALKVLHPQLAADEQFIMGFKREAAVAAKFDSPHIVTIFEHSQIDGYALIAMRYLPGGSLAQRLKTGPLTFDQAMAVMRDACKGLLEAHRQGVAHLDLKPSNILFDAQSRAVISDFGFARATRSGESSTSLQNAGTPAYCAPELWDETIASPGLAADVFALGCILYEMLTGAPLFSGTNLQLMKKIVADPLPVGADWAVKGAPRGLGAFLVKALCKDPARRIADADAFMREIEALAARENGRPLSKWEEAEARAKLAAEEKARREAELKAKQEQEVLQNRARGIPFTSYWKASIRAGSDLTNFRFIGQTPGEVIIPANSKWELIAEELTSYELQELVSVAAQGPDGLISFDLSRCPSLQDEDLEKLPSCRELISLNLRDCNRLTDDVFATIRHLENLSVLTLPKMIRITGNGHSLAHLAAICQKTCLMTDELELLGGTIDDATLKHLSEMYYLRKITFSDTYFDTVTNRGFAWLAQSKDIEELVFRDSNSLSFKEIPPLAGLKGLKEISFLDMSITNDDMKYICKLTQVERLTLNEVRDVSGSGLQRLRSIGNLKKLEIIHCSSINKIDLWVLRLNLRGVEIVEG